MNAWRSFWSAVGDVWDAFWDVLDISTDRGKGPALRCGLCKLVRHDVNEDGLCEPCTTRAL